MARLDYTPEWLWACQQADRTRSMSGFMRSFDQGASWTTYQSLDGTYIGYPVATAVDGSTNYVVYDSAGGGPHVLYVSTDNGRSWKNGALSLFTTIPGTGPRVVPGANRGKPGSTKRLATPISGVDTIFTGDQEARVREQIDSLYTSPRTARTGAAESSSVAIPEEAMGIAPTV